MAVTKKAAAKSPAKSAAKSVKRVSKKSAGEPMNTEAAAKYAGVSPKYLNDLRVRPTKGAGCPKFKKDESGRVTYAAADLDAWNAKRVSAE